MRYALLLARRHGQKAFEALGSSGEPKAVGDAFKQQISEPGDLAELHLIVSDQGVIKRHKFKPHTQNSPTSATPQPSPENAEAPTAATVDAGGSAPEPPAAEAESAGAGPDLLGETLAEADEAPAPPAKGKKGSN